MARSAGKEMQCIGWNWIRVPSIMWPEPEKGIQREWWTGQVGNTIGPKGHCRGTEGKYLPGGYGKSYSQDD